MGLCLGAAEKYGNLGVWGGRWEDKFHPEQVGVELKLEKKVQWEEPWGLGEGGDSGPARFV